MIRFRQKGDWSNTNKFFQRALEVVKMSDLDKYGRKGVAALSAMTPKDTGELAASWGYTITHKKGVSRIDWYNTKVNEGVPIAIVLQYGHANVNGGFVEGTDYVNPAMKAVFKQIADEAWRELTA